MVSAKRAYVAILVVALLIVGSTAAWMFYGQMPKKTPVRARQVMADNVVPPAITGMSGRIL